MHPGAGARGGPGIAAEDPSEAWRAVRDLDLPGCGRPGAVLHVPVRPGAWAQAVRAADLLRPALAVEGAAGAAALVRAGTAVGQARCAGGAHGGGEGGGCGDGAVPRRRGGDDAERGAGAGQGRFRTFGGATGVDLAGQRCARRELCAGGRGPGTQGGGGIGGSGGPGCAGLRAGDREGAHPARGLGCSGRPRRRLDGGDAGGSVATGAACDRRGPGDGISAGWAWRRRRAGKG